MSADRRSSGHCGLLLTSCGLCGLPCRFWWLHHRIHSCSSQQSKMMDFRKCADQNHIASVPKLRRAVRIIKTSRKAPSSSYEVASPKDTVEPIARPDTSQNSLSAFGSCGSWVRPFIVIWFLAQHPSPPLALLHGRNIVTWMRALSASVCRSSLNHIWFHRCRSTPLGRETVIDNLPRQRTISKTMMRCSESAPHKRLS